MSCGKCDGMFCIRCTKDDKRINISSGEDGFIEMIDLLPSQEEEARIEAFCIGYEAAYLDSVYAD